jgi:SAM-dependent methyltransferase
MQNNDDQALAAFFDSHVDNYETRHYGRGRHSFMTVREQRVLAFVDRLKLERGARALDAGCGPGYLLERLLTGGLVAHGLDASPAMVARARARVSGLAPEGPASVMVGDIERLPFAGDAFDLVCSTGVIEYLGRDSEVLAEFFRVLRPGGHLILSATNVWSPINYLEPVLEALKRTPWICRPVSALSQRMGHGPVLPRAFRVRRHRPARLKTSLRHAGFDLEAEAYFFFMPWPRPLDRVFPRLTERIGSKMERLSRSPLAGLAEGYLTLARKA